MARSWRRSRALAAAELPDRRQQRQARWADIRADPALDARVQTVTLGQRLIVLLRRFQQPGGVDAYRAVLDAPPAADAWVGIDRRGNESRVDGKLAAAADDRIRADADIAQCRARAQRVRLAQAQLFHDEAQRCADGGDGDVRARSRRVTD